MHKCPGCRTPGVPNTKFACKDCWSALPSDLKQPILRTAKMSLLEEERANAVFDAVQWYSENKR